ncbi:MAG: ABC transporter ATP-binding protein, partial [Acidimicrobiia bacterium]|nr:ABC transporter ATP-binding protein [Acidimicrobiia bacterium]
LVPAGTEVTGRVTLDGEDVLSLNPGGLRAIRWTTGAIVFQGALHALNPVQRIGKQIAEPMLIHETEPSEQAARKRAGELLEQVGLPAGRAAAYPHQLSGGQRQRVLIAMALACDPQLLIADEPTTALDLMVQAQVLSLLADLRKERGLSMVFITHDLSVLTSVCDDLAVMYAGKIVERGPSHQVFAKPAHPYTRALAAAFPTIGDRSSRMSPSGLGGDPPDPKHLPSGCAFHPRCPVALESCSQDTVDLRPAGEGRFAACVLVGNDV